MRIAAYLRGNASRTNERVTHFGDALGARLSTRERPIECDLAIQAGFQISPAMEDAMERGIPIIILENPVWHFGDKPASYVWGYNGLNGGSWAPPTPVWGSRYHPTLQPWKHIHSQDTVIFGQMEGDKSLRGGDIYAWIENMQQVYPYAEVREHPNMLDRVEKEAQEPFQSVMNRCSHAITFSSTTGAEAVIQGIVTEVYHNGSWAWPVRGGMCDRDQWIHDLSYRHWTTDKPVDVDWILSGYDEALAKAQRGEYDNMSNGRPQ